MIFLSIPAGLLIYVILAIVLRKKARLKYDLCKAHRNRYRLHVAITWLLLVLSVGLVILGAVQNSGPTALAGLALFFGGLIYAVIFVRILSPRRINDHVAWLRGAGEPFLMSLPEWPGAR